MYFCSVSYVTSKKKAQCFHKLKSAAAVVAILIPGPSDC